MPTHNEETSKVIFDATKALYDNQHAWIRQYTVIIVQLNSLALGGSATILAYFISLQWSSTPQPSAFAFLLLAPLTISGFAIWSTMALAKELFSAFGRIIKIEKHWKFYQKDAIIPNEALYEEKYARSDREMPDIPKHMLIVQIIALLLTVFVAGLSLTRFG